MATTGTTEQPLVRVSPTSKAALRAAQESIAAATGRPPVLGAIVDEILSAHLPAYVAARLATLQPAPRTAKRRRIQIPALGWVYVHEDCDLFFRAAGYIVPQGAATARTGHGDERAPIVGAAEEEYGDMYAVVLINGERCLASGSLSDDQIHAIEAAIGHQIVARGA